MLESHFVNEHPDLVNQHVPVPSDLLLPSWCPFQPRLSDPPSLPEYIPPGCILLSAVEGTCLSKSASLVRDHSLASVLSLPSSPKKRAKMDTPRQADDTSREVPSIVFDDMPRQVKDDTTYAGDVMLDSVVQLRHVSGDLARPPKMLTPEQCVHKPPPISIHYEVFSRRLQLEEMARDAAEAAKACAQTTVGSQRQVSKTADL
ncbi:hypothetical protein NLJ89_g1402 [Agrocybe chaxingu]|uniref:Uncharacterized protein n=1 Tax=Agrocybe chaxingu TaxID=84603 RepID=A0A9W8N030_9AGAR|nr:hypothetical protein NLJ89_g1402 [Agrocybe chaxingu]